MAVLTKEQWKRRRIRRKKLKKIGILAGFALIVILVLLLIIKVISSIFSPKNDGILKKAGDYTVKQSLLTVSDYSRPGIKLEEVTNIVIHYTGIPNMTAAEKRAYYESLKDKKETTESMHFIVDLDGTIYQLIPTTEVACASMRYNEYGISIEYCHTGADGSMTADTYQALVSLVATLCKQYDLKPKSVIRHYDITSLNCPAFFVQDEANWKQFQEDVAQVMKGKKIEVTSAPVTQPSDTPAPTDEPSGTPPVTPDTEPSGTPAVTS